MCILSSISAAEFSNGGQLYFSEFNFGTFRLQRNLAIAMMDTMMSFFIMSSLFLLDVFRISYIT